ncbi:hypothetical protein LWI29_030520 [Acer saccharum]|uniref:RNase H type-1 domain-containing protein n=1 Tax=Acer saccharum TaxID=4024 RepID=A0AA39VKG6_ACESA|nr:hypothetical protein LWI29_030520 [Acer saccharum]
MLWQMVVAKAGCKDCGLFPCVLESDEKVAVNRVLNINLLNASYGSILSDIADLRAQSMDLPVCVVPSSANCAAQCLANLALKSLSNSFWMEEAPPCIRGLIDADMLS